MIKNFLLITFRSMMKNKLYLFINIMGMSIAIACCIVGYFNYDFNASFDEIHLNREKVYRVNSIREFQNERTKFAVVPMALGNAMRQNSGDVREVICYAPGGGNFRIGQELFDMGLAFTDTGFFKTFTFEFLEGNGNLTDKSNIVINDETARKYFGSESALGKSLVQVLDSGKTKQFTITGVFKRPPVNSSFDDDAFTNFHNQFENRQSDFTENSWRYRTTLFVTVDDPNRISAIEAQIKPLTENNNKIREDFIIRDFQLESMVGMGVSDSYNNTPASWTREASPLAAVLGVGVMGIFVLLIACFNLTNTAIAISSRRLKEIGIRKVMGSQRKHLITQFIGETMMVCLVALLLGMVVAEFALIPAFNNLWPDLKLQANYLDKPNFLIFMGATLVFTGFLAGAYPAFYISKFQPVSILKGKLKFGGNNGVTYVLLTLQFVISLCGIVCSLAFTDNAVYQRDFDLGFDKKGVVYSYVNNRSEYETYRNALLANPDVKSVGGALHHFGGNWFSDPIKSTDGKEIEVDILEVGDDYVKTIDLKITEGRDFTKDSETDRKESVLISEALRSKMGWDKPIGKEIIWLDTVKLYVVGVFKDVYSRGLWEPIEPTMLRYAAQDKVNFITVSAPIDKIKSVNTFMEAKWKEIFPDRLYNGRLMDENLARANVVNNNILKMFIFLGVVALLLSATGLFTLVSLNIIKKMKEIGVRKVLGASVGNISRIINQQFMIVLGVACILGCVLGYFMAGALMSSIWTYYQNATTLTFILACLILLTCSVLSIAYKVYKTTQLNPSRVLKEE